MTCVERNNVSVQTDNFNILNTELAEKIVLPF